MQGNYYHGLLSTPDCQSCPLQMDRKVYPDGPVPARIAIVAEEPGRKECIEGRGLIGPSGQLLFQILAILGIQRSEVWVTNAMLCQARTVRLSNNALYPKMIVKAKAAACCRQRLLQELITVNPAVIVPVGNWALWAVTDIPKAKIFAYRGSIIDVDLQDLSHRVATGTARAPSRTVRAE